MSIKKVFIVSFIIVVALIVFKIYLRQNLNWTFLVENRIGSKTYSGSNLFFDNKYLYFSDQEEKIYCLNKISGKVVWIFDKHKNTPFAINILDKIYVTNFDSHIYSLSKKNGYPIWSYTIPNSILPDTEPVSDENDEMIFFADRSGVLYALSKINGSVVWTKNFTPIDNQKKFKENSIHFGFIKQDDKNLFITNSPQNDFQVIEKISGNTLYSSYYSFNDGYLKITDNFLILKKSKSDYVVIDKKTLKERWTLTDNSNTKYDLYTFSNSEDSILLEQDHTLTKIDANNKNSLWQNNYQYPFKTNVLDTINNQVVIGHPNFNRFNSKIEVLDSKTGKVNWESEILYQILNIQFIDNKYFVNTHSNKTIIYDSLAGKVIKEISTTDPVLKISNFDNNYLIITKDKGKKAIIYCIDKKNLEKLWRYKSDISIDSTEIYENDNRLYFLDDSKKLIQSIDITNNAPSMTTKTNFVISEKFGILRPGIEYIFNENTLSKFTLLIQNKFNRYLYVVKNFLKISSFETKGELNADKVFQITLSHDQNFYKNYFTDIKITTTFTSPDGKSFKTNGYYYDYNTWKINFNPTTSGKWKWRATIKTPHTVVFKNGDFNIEEVVKNNYISIQGQDFIVDDKVFFPIGIQDVISDQNYNGNSLDQMGYAVGPSPAVNDIDQLYISFDKYVDLYKKEANLNIYRINIDNVGPSLLKDLRLNNFDININDARFVDSMVQTLRRSDYKIMFSLFGFYPPYQDSEKTINANHQKEVEAYLDYMIARYGPYVDIWEISNEASIPINWLNFISDYIRRKDVYKHPITTNWEEKGLKNSDLLSTHWYASVNEKLNLMGNQVDYIKTTNTDWSKAILISEFGFKGSSHLSGSADYMRLFTWLSIFNKMGIIYWNTPIGIYSNTNNANIYLGPIERKYIKNLQDFLPKLTQPLKSSRMIYNEPAVDLYKLENEDYILGYVINQKDKDQYNISIQMEIIRPAVIEWHDTITGRVINTYILEANTNLVTIPYIRTDVAFKIRYN